MTPHSAGELLVVPLATGGTIASRSRPESGGAAMAADSGEQLLGSVASSLSPVRGLAPRKGTYLLDFDETRPICSSVRTALRNPAVLGVVKHGMDTLEKTFFPADLAHDDLRPVVFSGAQKAADSASTDGPENLAQVVALAASPRAGDRGVLVSFATRIFRAHGLQKAQTVGLDAFANAEVGAASRVSASGAVHLTEAPRQEQAAPYWLQLLRAGGPGSTSLPRARADDTLYVSGRCQMLLILERLVEQINTPDGIRRLTFDQIPNSFIQRSPRKEAHP
jgi:L-asparaginase